MTAPRPTDEQIRIAVATMLSQLDPTLAARLVTEPDAHLELVDLTARTDGEVAQILQGAVTAARAAGASWAAIGETLGTTRQAAQQRFGRADAPDHGTPAATPDHGTPAATAPATADDAAGTADAGSDVPERRRIVGLTAFNEMDVLADAGRHGWHSVGFGALYHDVERSPVQWEHQRTNLLDRYRLEPGAGWHPIRGLWFPWRYFARPTDRPAEPGEPAAFRR